MIVVLLLHPALSCLYEAVSVPGAALANLDLFLVCHCRLSSVAARTVSMKAASLVSVAEEKARGVQEAGKPVFDVALRPADMVGQTLYDDLVIEWMRMLSEATSWSRPLVPQQ